MGHGEFHSSATRSAHKAVFCFTVQLLWIFGLSSKKILFCVRKSSWRASSQSVGSIKRPSKQLILSREFILNASMLVFGWTSTWFENKLRRPGSIHSPLCAISVADQAAPFRWASPPREFSCLLFITAMPLLERKTTQRKPQRRRPQFEAERWAPLFSLSASVVTCPAP